MKGTLKKEKYAETKTKIQWSIGIGDNRCMNKQLETEQKLLSITEVLSQASHRFLR